MTEYIWREISCPTKATEGDFARGTQNFRFNVGHPNAWIPAKSYFKVDMTLTEGAESKTEIDPRTVITGPGGYAGDNFSGKPRDVALAENAVSCLYKSCQMTIGGRPVSFASDLPQIQQVKTRLSTTHEWQESVGKASFGLGSDFVTRLAETATQNTVSRIWQPPIGIFDFAEPIGAGDYCIKLDPNAEFEKAAVECNEDRGIGTKNYVAEVVDGSGAVTTPAVPAEYKLVINKVRFFVCMVKLSVPSGVTSLALRESESYSKILSSDNTIEFTVPSSTDAITLFVQGGKAGSTNQLPPTKFKCIDDSDSSLTSLQITYANVTKPPTRIGSVFSPAVNTTQQRYLETHLESGLAESEGGSETLKDYYSRGMMYHYSFKKDAEDKSTQVQVSMTIPSIVANEANLFLVAHYTRITDITTQNGHTTDVKSFNV